MNKLLDRVDLNAVIAVATAARNVGFRTSHMEFVGQQSYVPPIPGCQILKTQYFCYMYHESVGGDFLIRHVRLHSLDLGSISPCVITANNPNQPAFVFLIWYTVRTDCTYRTYRIEVGFRAFRTNESACWTVTPSTTLTIWCRSSYYSQLCC